MLLGAGSLITDGVARGLLILATIAAAKK